VGADQPRIIASCLLFNDANELLLLQRHRLARGGGYWAPPGGKLEAGEDLEQAMIREVMEESGIQLASPTFLGFHDVFMPHGSVRMATFTAALPSGAVVTLNPEEHEDHNWHSSAALLGQPQLIWGLPTIMRDFGLLETLEVDHTLGDGSRVVVVR